MDKLSWWNPFDWGQIMIVGAKTKIHEILVELFEDVIFSSYYICLIGGMIGLILYIFGYKKGKNYPLISIAIYMIINILGRVLLGVR